MKKYLYGSALLLFLSFLLLQSTSFSNTEMLNKATVSSVAESEALLSVHYGEGRLFRITNNTENIVHVRETGSIAPNESFQIGPGRSNSFTILGHPEEIYGSILLDFEWDGGFAMIESEIPQSNIEQILLELLEEDEEIIEVKEEDEEEEIVEVKKEEEVTVQEDAEENDEVTTNVQEEEKDENTSEAEGKEEKTLLDELEVNTEIDDDVEE